MSLTKTPGIPHPADSENTAITQFKIKITEIPHKKLTNTAIPQTPMSPSRRRHKAIMMLQSLNGLAPVYLEELFSERHMDYHLRDSFYKLNLPKPRTNYLKRSFGYSGALL